MKRIDRPRLTAMAMIGLALVATVGAGRSATRSVYARATRTLQGLARGDRERADRQERLKSQLRSPAPTDFLNALDTLAAMDEDGALDVWDVALQTADTDLKKEAWRCYFGVRPLLARKQFVPEITRISAPASVVDALARAADVEITVLRSGPTETIAALAPYFSDRLRRGGLAVTGLYESIAEMERSGAAGDGFANKLAADYQAGLVGPGERVRIAVVELPPSADPAPGYSDWLGDGENFLMRNASFLAYLDIFQSDGSPASLQSHVEEHYLRRGYRLAGFFTLEEFAENVGRFFPGRAFDPGRRSAATTRSGIQPALFNGRFHSFQDAQSEFTALAAAHPDLAQMVNLGLSFEGRQIFALKITRDPQTNDPGKPDVLITGCHHAREWISVEPPVYFANQLINGYASDDSVKYLVDHLQIWIVPVVNPDGLTYSQGAPNDQLDDVRLWRKNRRPITVPGCGSGVGVDLNRNYNFQWRLPGDQPCPNTSDDIGASDDPSSEIYRGAVPESEPELKALDALTGDPNRRFQARLDYHNFMDLILYPWGYQNAGTVDASTLAGLGQRMSDLALASSRESYKPEQAIRLYITSGSSVDYSYAVNHIPAPFIVELRPSCCNFNVPETDIAPIDQESWAGARILLNWSAGPPILQSVQAYQAALDGSLSRQVYSARWVGAGASRQMIVDARFPALLPGPIQFKLQFSKPMDTGSAPGATIGRSAPFNELKLLAADASEGWQKTVYMNDTWVGEATIPQDTGNTSPWRLSVSAADAVPLSLDANPATVAVYTAGSGFWQQYEDSAGAGSAGGADIQNILGSTSRSGVFSITVDAPGGGERLAGGDYYSVAWTVSRPPGSVTAVQEIWLSTDAGNSFSPVADRIPGTADSFAVLIPNAQTTAARIKVLAQDAATGNFAFGDSQGSFTIGTNVGSGIDVSLASSQLVDESWTDTAPGGSGAGGSSRLIINLSITSHGSVAIANPFFRVVILARGNVLLNRDASSPPGSGSRRSIDPGSDGLLSPGKTVQVQLVVGLVTRKKFDFTANIFGVAVGGAAGGSDPVSLWHGKPRTN